MRKSIFWKKIEFLLFMFSSKMHLEGNDHLIEFHLTFSVDRNFLIIWAFDRNFYFFILVSWSNYLTCFQLIDSSNNGILGFKKDSINCQNPSVLFCQLIKIFIDVILSYFKISINCQNPSVLFWQLIKFFDQLKSVQNFSQLIMKVSINW